MSPTDFVTCLVSPSDDFDISFDSETCCHGIIEASRFDEPGVAVTIIISKSIDSKKFANAAKSDIIVD